jgi:hypothetical protein
MTLSSIRRREGKLEAINIDPPVAYQPLSADEIEALVLRASVGGTWTDEETARVLRQCPIRQGALSIGGSGNRVFIKRIIGVDPSLI